MTGSDPQPTDRGYEAEVALAVGHSAPYDELFQFPTVVVAFNDQRPDSLSSGLPEWEWFGGASGFEQVRFRRGGSFMGWAWGTPRIAPPSTPFDSRLDWTYGGKLRPPAGTSMVYADPSIASFQPYFPNLVYMAYMGVSDARWNVRSGGSDEILIPGSGFSPDQFCAARSVDGGRSFNPPTCTSVVVADVAHLVDKTALAVDFYGRAWVAVEVHGVPHPEPGVGATGVIRVFRNRAANGPDSAVFDEVSIPAHAVEGVGNRDPVLRASPDGWAISLSSVLEPTDVEEPRRIRYADFLAAADPQPAGVDLFRSVCSDVSTRPRAVDDGVTLGRQSSARRLRTGVRVSHATGYSGDTFVVRFAYEYLNANARPQVQILELYVDDDGEPACIAPEEWTSAYPPARRGDAQAFQPQISYHMRRLRPEVAEDMPSRRGIIPDGAPGEAREWQVAWYGTLLTEATPVADVQVVSHTLVPGNTVTGVLLPVSEYYDTVCPLPANDYWGDYFGLGQYYDQYLGSWMNVAGYSRSDPAGEPGQDCFQRAGYYASPLHVGASTWPSFP